MPVLNSYYPHGSASEQSLYQSLITESIHIKGEEFYYIPRTLVAKDDILTEDSLSRFKSAYPFAGYVEDINQWAGAGSFSFTFIHMISIYNRLYFMFSAMWTCV